MNQLLSDTTVTTALLQSCVERKIQLHFRGCEIGNSLSKGEKQEELKLPVFLRKVSANFRLLFMFGGVALLMLHALSHFPKYTTPCCSE
jgi:hypothetical protein